MKAFRAERGWDGGGAQASRIFPDGSFGVFTHDYKTTAAVAQALDARGAPMKLSDVDDIVRGELALVIEAAKGAI
jgi:hypothetical protein